MRPLGGGIQNDFPDFIPSGTPDRSHSSLARWIMSRTVAFLCLVAAAAAGSFLPATARGNDAVEMSLPLFREPTHQIASVDQDAKTATVKPRPQSPFATAGEGLAVVLLSSSGRGPFDTLVRVDVQEVLDGGEMIVAFGDGAAAAACDGGRLCSCGPLLVRLAPASGPLRQPRSSFVHCPTCFQQTPRRHQAASSVRYRLRGPPPDAHSR